MKREIFKTAGFIRTPENIINIKSNNNVSKWLEEQQVPDALDFYNLSSDANFIRYFNEVWNQVLEKTELQNVVYVISNYLFDDSFPPAWDMFERNRVDMLPAVIILTGWQQHMKNMAKKNFSPEQIEFHKNEIKNSITNGLYVYNQPGMLMSGMIWSSIVVRANLIKLGRLQYETKTAEDFYACKDIAAGENIIGMHIPRGQPLFPEDVNKSITEAKKYFGNAKFVCETWLLGKELGDYLKPESNIANFRNHFNVVKTLDTESIYHFLFNDTSKKPDIPKLPQDTSLRKSVKQAMLSGGHFHDAVGVLSNNLSTNLHKQTK